MIVTKRNAFRKFFFSVIVIMKLIGSVAILEEPEAGRKVQIHFQQRVAGEGQCTDEQLDAVNRVAGACVKRGGDNNNTPCRRAQQVHDNEPCLHGEDGILFDSVPKKFVKRNGKLCVAKKGKARKTTEQEAASYSVSTSTVGTATI